MHVDGGGLTPQVMQDPLSVEFIVLDLFCGGGGVSTGFYKALISGGRAAVIMACVNHDPKAIKSHWMNYPEVVHFEEDIKTVAMQPLVDLLNIYRNLYPNAKFILWASLECTNFSKAKGGQPREADSRTLAEHLDRYILALDPDYVQIENVVEFQSWGPLDDKGKPVSRKSGSDSLKWCQYIDSLGYRNEWKEMNSADFGAYTSRNRLFGCFAKDGLPIVWPETTHTKKPGIDGMFGIQQKWKAVKEVLDFDDEGMSIFNRKKPLVDASLERIEAGLIKFIAGGKEAFILKYNSTDQKGVCRQGSVDDPCPTIATQNRLGLVNTHFLAKYYSGKASNMVLSVENPAATLRTKDGQSLIQCEYFLSKTFSGKPEGKVIPVTGPAGTITTFGSHQLINCVPFIMNTNFRNVGSSINEPAKTLLASRHHPYIVNPAFLTQYYSSGGELASIDEPARTLGTRDTIAKVQTVFFDKTFGGNGNANQCQSINNPAGTIMPNDKHRLIKCQPFILNPSHGGHCTGTDVPCVVIVARQDKAPLSLVQFAIDKNVSIAIYEDDSPVMIRIKKFMALYGLSDIKMRMLKVSELLPIQGFPIDYKLFGNQTDQKKFIGNSVVPHVVTAWCEAMAIRIRALRITAA